MSIWKGGPLYTWPSIGCGTSQGNGSGSLMWARSFSGIRWVSPCGPWVFCWPWSGADHGGRDHVLPPWGHACAEQVERGNDNQSFAASGRTSIQSARLVWRDCAVVEKRKAACSGEIINKNNKICKLSISGLVDSEICDVTQTVDARLAREPAAGRFIANNILLLSAHPGREGGGGEVK